MQENHTQYIEQCVQTIFVYATKGQGNASEIQPQCVQEDKKTTISLPKENEKFLSVIESGMGVLKEGIKVQREGGKTLTITENAEDVRNIFSELTAYYIYHGMREIYQKDKILPTLMANELRELDISQKDGPKKTLAALFVSIPQGKVEVMQDIVNSLLDAAKATDTTSLFLAYRQGKTNEICEIIADSSQPQREKEMDAIEAVLTQNPPPGSAWIVVPNPRAFFKSEGKNHGKDEAIFQKPFDKKELKTLITQSFDGIESKEKQKEPGHTRQRSLSMNDLPSTCKPYNPSFVAERFALQQQQQK